VEKNRLQDRVNLCTGTIVIEIKADLEISNRFFCITNDYRLSIDRVIEAPTSDALQKSSIAPEIVKWMAWNTSETKLAMGLEESMRLLEQVK
jgi:hypothetical protein